MLKLDRDHLSAEISALESLLAHIPTSDFLGRMGLESRRRELTQRYANLVQHEEHSAKVALYFGGDPVVGSVGVQVGFATDVVGTFQELLSKVWGSTTGQLASMGPIKDKPASQLHITSVVHGSFGFLLEEVREATEPMFDTPLKQAADQVAEYIASFAAEDDRRFSEVIEQINQRVFESVRQFFKFLHREGATFRMVGGERDERYDRAAVERAWNRADGSSVDDEPILVEGLLLGIAPVQRRFDFQPDGGAVIKGKVGAELSENYLQRVSQEHFAGKRWKATINKHLVKKVGRQTTESYTLVNLEQVALPPNEA